MSFLTRIEALKDLIQEAVDKGATTVEQIHQTIAAMPLEALEKRGLLEGKATQVRETQAATIGAVYDAIRKVKGQVRVTGHSDNRPIATLRFPSNWALSEARAKSVLEILAAKTGQAERFSAEGRSDTEPVASNDSAAGRAKNRRVEITVLAEGNQ